MKKILLGGIFLSACVAMQSSAGVFDDVKIWWHLDFDANSDGLVQVDELRDQRDWGSISTKGAGGYHAANLSTGDAIEWSDNVPITSGGLPYGDMAIEFQPVTNIVYTYTTNVVQVVTTNEFEEVVTNMVDVVTTNQINQCWPETIKVTGAAVTSNCTVLCRFRWDGPAMEEWQQPGWIVNNALDWSRKLGWMFGPRKDGNNWYLGMYIAQEAQYYYAVPLIRGTWYEAAAVLRDNGGNDTVTFYLWPEDIWADETTQNDKSGLTWQTYNSSWVTNYITSSDITVGGESQYNELGSQANATKCFRGALNYLAIWDRDLSHNEVLEAFSYYNPLVTVGIDDDSNYDMIVESEADAIYDAGDPWHTMRRAVTVSRPETTIRVNLTALQAQQNYVFHMDTHGSQGGQTADLDLVVNSTTNAAITMSPGMDYYWDIPAGQLVTGQNTFTIRYVDGPSFWMSWDWIEIFGSWQVGYDNDTQSEFVREVNWSPDYFISDPDWKHCRRAVVTTRDVNLNFTLSEEMLARHLFTYTSEIIQQGGTNPTPPHKLQLSINGNIVTNNMEVPNNTTVIFPDIKPHLVAGNNKITWKNVDTGGWAQFDYHKIAMALPPGPPKGTLILLY